eukprot:CAMPEP_0197847222 /NCGR_PEP_ID=MMETSP1438-20131217/5582_1 /TAXON_ID=1461541 /ORGANISM="Pterosperma sp., Strain CCMP1384" /LENGTH=137 /DNA_ID=CAMNT_0043459083 /DNA_START=416 /DNA_END=829 /DNA_ORIENTATION=+
MDVPSDSFGGLSPERKCSNAMMNLFTFIAARVVLSQMCGSGTRSDLGSYNTKDAHDLQTFLEDHPVTNADEWCEKLLQKNKMLGMRVLEVRVAYADDEFEWEELAKLSKEMVHESNTKLMRECLISTIADNTVDPHK